MTRIRFLFHFATGSQGTVGSVVFSDSPSITNPVASVGREGERIVFQLPTIYGRFAGEFSGDSRTISGEWTQGRSYPLTLNWQEGTQDADSIARSVAVHSPLPRFHRTRNTTPSDDAILEVLKRRIDIEHQNVGIVVGIIEPEGRRVISYGALNQGDPRTLNGDTVFEIASLTKLFTALLLADMGERGEVAFDDFVTSYLPPETGMPRNGGENIRLIDLATHTSGLPRLPDNLTPSNPANPLADYSVEDLYEFLGASEMTQAAGTTFNYSNLGMGLLGHVLALYAGQSYEALVHGRILLPLGMENTAIELSPEQMVRFAVGHDPQLEVTNNEEMPTLAGAGALRSTANDLLTFLEAELDYAATPLARAMTTQLATRRAIFPRSDIAMGWFVASTRIGDIFWADGETNGHRSFIAFDPMKRVGVVVLSNTRTRAPWGVDDIGFHILDPIRPVLVSDVQ
jgi:D-alanyl-D-alanine-carboxypeptidase/D-alanyl-D-alanine-endopeptidase